MIIACVLAAGAVMFIESGKALAAVENRNGL
jgi:hypothetical protein